MDSRARIPSFACLFHLLLLLCSLVSAFDDSSSITANSNDGSGKVSLDVYYESLCPDSVKFIVDDLIKLFEGGLVSIVDLRLVPYGNARVGRNSSITCQHGPSECFLNTVEACAINAWPELTGHFPFIFCVEAVVYERKYTQWETCYEKLGLDPKPVYECYSSGLGKELELQYAAETDHLQPPHKYVPWVVVDGQPLYEDFENFVSYICKAYKGSYVPSACRAESLSAI
ncbi:gamma-interferon-inducible lysosomal thiol reductase-like [Momordica charantia]|uniref:Gamma-interferon-inducible lysosomal thiol reductase-like n=1 Tax=Momordica charantia TaxID=3673 RepID=A0A6J1DLJ0_MOMCH|nr:gamma-interferon-inducible lysosomal thiol reductase-like [Momordica charantia]